MRRTLRRAAGLAVPVTTRIRRSRRPSAPDGASLPSSDAGASASASAAGSSRNRDRSADESVRRKWRITLMRWISTMMVRTDTKNPTRHSASHTKMTAASWQNSRRPATPLMAPTTRTATSSA